MSDPQNLRIENTVENRQVLQGRLVAAKWLSLSEPQVCREIRDLEGQELFKELLCGRPSTAPILRRSRWPSSGLSKGFYELREEAAAGSDSGDVQELLEKKEDLFERIRRIGQDDFERYFLYGEEGIPLGEICRRLGISEADGGRILDLVLDVGMRSEFYQPGKSFEGAGLACHCIAEIVHDPGHPEGPYFRFLSAHWARGRYVVDYDSLERWKDGRPMGPSEKRALKRILKTVELINMRQDTLFQILSRVTSEQAPYLRTRAEHLRRPLSLRELARRIGVAPSTVSRAVGGRSIRLPWGEEVPLRALMVGQREVILSLLAQWRQPGSSAGRETDESLREKLSREAGIRVSRRTVNECRRVLDSQGKPPAGAGGG